MNHRHACLADVSDNDLLLILDNDQNKTPLINQLISRIAQHEKLNRNKISLSLLSSINGSSIPVNIFWGLVSLVSLGAAAIFLAGATALLAIGISIASFTYSYHKKCREEKEEEQDFRILFLKNKVLDEIFFRKNYQSVSYDHCYEVHSNKKNEGGQSTPSKWSSAGVAATTGAILFGTFFWGVLDILTTLKLISVAAMFAGPIGMAVAGAIIVGIAIFVGIKHHEYKKNKKLIKIEKSILENEVSNKIQELKIIERGYACSKIHESNEEKTSEPLRNNIDAHSPVIKQSAVIKVSKNSIFFNPKKQGENSHFPALSMRHSF